MKHVIRYYRIQSIVLHSKGLLVYKGNTSHNTGLIVYKGVVIHCPGLLRHTGVLQVYYIVQG